jgi:hypothetical protein
MQGTRAEVKTNKNLTALRIAKITAPGTYAVGEGTYLQIKAVRGRSWVFRYMRNGKRHTMGLGPVSLVTLAEAREKGRQARRQLLEGIDPLEARKAVRARAGSMPPRRSLSEGRRPHISPRTRPDGLIADMPINGRRA